MDASARSTAGASAAAPRPTVSVVIPVKDDAVLLRRCLAALGAQTRVPDEIVVVDNGSVDASAAVARRAGAVVVHCADAGIPAAASRGYDAASGDIILRLDADCVPAPTWVELMCDTFATHPEIDALTGHASFIDGPVLLRRPLAALYLGAYRTVCGTALGHRPLFGSNLGMRRSAWRAVSEAVHRADSDVHDDLDLSYHLGISHRIGTVEGARMGMSMRPFASATGMRRRVRRGFHTVTSHWPDDFPPRRWRELVRRRAASESGEESAALEAV